MKKAYNILSKIAKIVNMINHIMHAVFFWLIVPIGGIIVTNILKKQYKNGQVPTLVPAILSIILAPNPFFALGVIAGGLSIACAIIGKKLPAPAEEEEYVEEIAE